MSIVWHNYSFHFTFSKCFFHYFLIFNLFVCFLHWYTVKIIVVPRLVTKSLIYANEGCSLLKSRLLVKYIFELCVSQVETFNFLLSQGNSKYLIIPPKMLKSTTKHADLHFYKVPWPEVNFFLRLATQHENGRSEERIDKGTYGGT
jgi:hypothetical protein